MAEAVSIDEPRPSRVTGERALSVWTILRNSSKVSGANLLNALVLFPVNIVVARVLGPELLGVVGYVALWQLYASLSRPGMFNAAYREMPALLVRGKKAEAIRVQNVGVTGDGLYLLLPIGFILIAGSFQQNVLLRNGLIIGALVFGLSQARDFAANLQWAHQRFGLIARANALSALVRAVFVLSTIWWLKVYTPLLAPAVSALTVLIGYRLWAPPLGFRPLVDRQEMWRMLRIGLPLGLLSVFYWGFRTVDRAAVATWLTLTDLGYFTFVMQFINIAILLVSDFGNVLQPTLWAEMGQKADWQVLGPRVRKLSLFVLVVTCAGANFAQAGFGAFVRWFVPRFGEAVTTFEILALLLACGTIGIVPLHVLTSSVVNRQQLAAAVYGMGVPLNVGLAYWAVRAGWGVNGIAFSSVFAQALVSATLLILVRRYYFSQRPGQVAFYFSMLSLLLVALGVFVLYHTAPLSFAGSNGVVVPLALRLALACLVWGSIAGVVYWYWRHSAATHQSGGLL